MKDLIVLMTIILPLALTEEACLRWQLWHMKHRFHLPTDEVDRRPVKRNKMSSSVSWFKYPGDDSNSFLSKTERRSMMVKWRACCLERSEVRFPIRTEVYFKISTPPMPQPTQKLQTIHCQWEDKMATTILICRGKENKELLTLHTQNTLDDVCLLNDGVKNWQGITSPFLPPLGPSVLEKASVRASSLESFLFWHFKTKHNVTMVNYSGYVQLKNAAYFRHFNPNTLNETQFIWLKDHVSLM